jgi:exopolysaccharide production negative regulator
MRTCSLLGALAVLVVLAPLAVGAEDVPPYASATAAYRQGIAAIKAGDIAAALPSLVYAADHQVLGAQLKLARLYMAGVAVPKDDAKAFTYYQQIADERAESNPRSPIARFVAEAFVALGRYYQFGLPALSLTPNPVRAAGLYRHAASYFGDADAQYALARLYLTGDGVDKNVGLAANWLAMAAKKQHPAAQATLGELLWHGDIRARPAKGLALIMLAHENAKASGKEPDWMTELYLGAVGAADADMRKEARALIPELGGTAAAAAAMPVAAPAQAGSGEPGVVPASGGRATAASAPAVSAATPAAIATGETDAKPAELPVGFAKGAGEFKP